MYQIDKNVPIPTTGRGRRKSKYPFEQMEIGDSFLIPKDMKHFSMHYNEKKYNHQYTSRKVEGGLRVWRIA